MSKLLEEVSWRFNFCSVRLSLILDIFEISIVSEPTLSLCCSVELIEMLVTFPRFAKDGL